MTAAIAAVVVLALPSGASAYDAKLKRYPYLTDLVGTSVMVNWATDISSTSAVVKYGLNGTTCDTNTVTATRTFILVNGVSEYQWKAQLTGLAPDTEYCYRVYFGSSQLDLLGTDGSPVFRTQIPAGSSQPFKFAVWGNWGKTLAAGNTHQANLISQIAQSGARFAVTAGDNAYETGSQKSYGDLYQVGDNTSAVFGPSYWKVAGASLPIFPTVGNHDHNNSVLLTNFPQDTAVATSGGQYTTQTYCCTNGTTQADYPNGWYAFDAGLARFYVLETAWEDTNVGTANLFKNDFDNHWGPNSPQYQWLKNDLETHPRAVRFAFHHFPMYSDQSATSSDTYLQGASSLEGLLKLHDVTIDFSAHSHNYQRNSVPPGGVPTYVSGGGGANLESIGNHSAGCSALDQYGLGWSNLNNTGHACGAAPVPTGKDQVHHFLLVSVSGTSVTVTPTDSLGRTFDPVTYNAPAQNADLSLTKTDSPDPVLIGQELTYDLTVDNTGPRSATGVQVTDTLPTGVTFESATPSQGTCSQTGNTVTCSLGTVSNGGNATVQIKVRPQNSGSISNTASVASDVNDPSTGNNSASATTTVDPVADLSLTKTDAPDPVAVGQQLTYTLGVSNTGPSSATGVTVTDTLPAGVTFDSATPSQGSCSQSSGTVTCSLGTIANGANAGVEIKVVPSSGGTITNQASVLSPVTDPDSADNSASADTTVNGDADLSLTKTDSPDPVLSGNQLTYTLVVHNDGPASAPSASLSDSLPAGVTFVSASPTQGSCVRSGSTVTCALGTVASGASVTIEIKVDTGAPATITNEATVLSTATDPNTVNNTASATTTVKPVADLGLTKTDSPDPVLAGQLLTYALGVSNAGPHTATGVTVTDTLPTNADFDSATPSQGSCFESGGTVTCALGAVANGGGASVEIKVRPHLEGTVNNEASVASPDAGDLNQSNNSASATTTVDPAADLELTKTGSPDPVLSGQQLTYDLTVHNAGPSATSGVAMSDSLPAGVTFVSATASQGSCFRSGATVLCSLGTLADEASATVQIKVTTQAPGTLTNNANVLGSIVDPDTDDNTASVDTTVAPAADLSLTNSDSPDPVAAGDPLTYSLGVQNAGPQDATGVTLTDTLPAGVTFESATPTQGTCSESGGTVTCALGAVANGASAGVDIEVRKQEGGQITNEAAVGSDQGDPSPQNNSASAATTVTAVADLAVTKSESPDPVLAGEPLTYLVTAQNSGPSTATGVELIDTLPAGVSFESATPTQGSCSESAGAVTCALGTIAPSQQANAIIVVRASSPDTITNQVAVTSATDDPVSSNNSASAETTVNAAADLSVTKSDSPDPVLAGELLTYTLTAHNSGPQDATGVTLTDTLPPGVTYESATPTQGSCSEAGGTVTCTLGTIADAGDAGVEINVRPAGPGSITNQADLTSDLSDPDPTDNSASADTTVNPAADLSLTKTDSPDPAIVDVLLTYTLEVQNAGPQDATGVALTDTLPAGVTFDSATPSQGNCSESEGTVSCALGTIANAGSASVEVKVTPLGTGSITNQASVTSEVADRDSDDTSASAVTTVNAVADLSLTKGDSPDPVLAGELLTYLLTAQNAGPSPATSAQLTDTLPAGVTFDSATPTQGSCSEAGGTVTCALGTIASSQQASVVIQVRSPSPGTITNQAEASSAADDPVSSNNSASSETTVTAAADLSLTKTDSPDPVLEGQILTYALTAHNSGPQDATGATLTDTLPAGVTFETATPTQGSCSESGGTVTCALGTIADEGSANVEIKVRPTGPGSLTNQAAVTSDLADPDSADASANTDTTVRPVADLSLTKSDSPDPALTGELLTYSLTVGNSGPRDATLTTLTDTLPAGVTLDSATPTQGGCSEVGGTITCALGTVANGGSASVEIKVRPQDTGTITNQASVVADEGDSNTSDNSASVDTTVNPAADLSVTKSDSPDPVLAGELLTYTLAVQNSGPSTATGVLLSDTLPAGAAFDSATPTQGSCTESAGTVDCALGTVANGGSASVEIKVRPAGPGVLSNQASVLSLITDPDSADNSASADTTVNAAADLSLTKSDSPDPVFIGDLLTYTLNTSNSGPQDATGVTLTDTLPGGVTFDSATPSQGSCTESGGTVTCALGTIANAGSASVEIKVSPQAAGSITNQASVTSDLADHDSDDTSASVVTTVKAVADLSLTKGDSPDPVLAGELLTYTLSAHNSGPQEATGVTLTDTLPAGVTFESATPTQGSCSEVSGTVTCALGTLTDEGTAGIEIKVRRSTPGTITNNADVTSDAHDPNSADNAASATTTVDAAADLSLTKSDSPDPVLAGELLTYTLNVSNAGPQAATGVALSDTLPAGVTFESVTSSQGACSETGGTVDCALGTVANGGSASVEIEVRPQVPGSITNQASVLSFVADPDSADRSASTDTTVNAAADLSLTKTDSPDPVFVDDLITYTLDVNNAGPQDATGVTLTDTLPDGVTFNSAIPTQGGCSEASGTVTCALGTIANGGTANVEITVTPHSAGSITNQAAVTSDVADRDSDDTSASATTTVKDVADLSLTKGDSPDPVLAGELLTYALSAHNSGPQEATGVTITDTLPTGVTFVSATPTQGSCSEASGTVTCALGTLADQANADVEIQVRHSTPGTITNQATITSDAHDPNTADNSASAETTVDPAADLSLTKTDAPDPVLSGELVAYTLTAHNGGPQDATGVTVSDTLPAGVSFDSATPSQGSCSEAAGIVTCAVGTVANQATATVVIKVRPPATGTISNQAGVSSALGDPSSQNNFASADTTVSATATGFPRPVSASPFLVSLVPSYSECTSPNREHGPPLDSPSCNPPVQRSDFLTVGTFDANARNPGMTGSVRFTVVTGTPSTPADEADVKITTTIKDVRDRTTLADYTGEVQGRIALRITDRRNGATGTDTATVSDVPYSFTVPCTATASTSVGSTCTLATTADSITPNTIAETKRTMWQLGDLEVLDGGPDGDVDTADNTVFLRQGIFVP